MIPSNNTNKQSNPNDPNDASFAKRRLVKPDQSKLAGSSSSSNLQKFHHHQLHLPQSDSKLYNLITIEPKDSVELSLEEAYNKLQNLINPTQQSDSSGFNELSQYANQSKQHNDEVSNALLYSILIDPASSSKCLRYLFLCNNVSFNMVQTESTNIPYGTLINNLLSIIIESYSKLQDIPRQQLLWLIKELAKSRVNQFEKLMLHMIRNIQSGCLNDKNIWLAESILDIFTDQTTTGQSQEPNSQSLWIYQYNELMTQTVYGYIRLISDHAQSSTLQLLRQRETDFCVQILREKWNDCMLIGRDLVRLLQNVARIPEFEALWKDIVTSPQLLSPQFAQLGGLLYLMKSPTKRRCLISRLTVDMERKIYFLITQVKAGQQKKYLEWFQRQYLNTPESQSLRVDMMRYICVVVHPTNEQLNAGLCPRWALCSWLLNTCTSPVDSANLKLALYYDWLMYDSKKENIMLIEPAILLMFNLIRLNNIPGLTLSMLFDFLCRIVLNYHIPFREHILNGIMQSFKDSVDKRVIPSTQIFFGTQPDPKSQVQVPCLDRDLKNFIQLTFGNFFQTLSLKPVQEQTPNVLQSQSSVTTAAVAAPPSVATSFPKLEKVEIKQENEFQAIRPDTESFMATFSSDDEDDLEVKAVTASVVQNTNNVVVTPSHAPSVTITDSIQLQLQQFLQKPFKLYTTLDDTQSVVQSLTSTTIQSSNIDSQLNMINSDDLRDKLNELNSKLKEYYHSLQSSLSSSWSTKSYLVNSLFKECLNFIYRDPEFSDSTLLCEVAVCLSAMFKNDFTNNLLPNQFYKNEIDVFDPNCFTLLNECILQKPIFIFFKELAATPNLSNEREILTQLLAELYLKQNRIGYYFLFYIYTISLKNQFNSTQSSQSSNEITSLVRILNEFVKERTSLSKNIKDDDIDKVSSTSGTVTDDTNSDDGNVSESEEEFSENEIQLGNCLMQDLRVCQQDDPILFCFMLPFVCGSNLLPKFMVNNSELLYLVVSCIDSRQLKDIVSNITTQDLELLKQPEEETSKGKAKKQNNKSSQQSSKKVVSTTGVKRKRKSSETNEKVKKRRIKKGKFRKETLIDVLSASLNWESVEQIFFWEILLSHDDITLEYLLPIFNRLDSVKNSEAVCYLFQMIKSSDPTYDLIKYIVQRKVEDNVARALFINWSKKTSNSQMSQIFIKLLNKSANQQALKSESTLKKIKYNETLNSNNKVKLTAQQQLEQNQKRGSSIYDEEDLNKIPNLDQVLGHLNKLRLNNACISFILNENLIECLKKIYNKNLDDDLKKKYSDLFTLADEFNQNDEHSHSEEDNDNEEDNEDKNSDSDDDERKSSKKNKGGKKGKRSKSSRGKRVKKTKFKASSSGDEDDQNDDDDNQDNDDDDDNNEDDNEDEEDQSSNSSSDGDTTSKKKKNQKRAQTKSSNHHQPPRKKLKHLKNSDNDSDE